MFSLKTNTHTTLVSYPLFTYILFIYLFIYFNFFSRTSTLKEMMEIFLPIGGGRKINTKKI